MPLKRIADVRKELDEEPDVIFVGAAAVLWGTAALPQRAGLSSQIGGTIGKRPTRRRAGSRRRGRNLNHVVQTFLSNHRRLRYRKYMEQKGFEPHSGPNF
jgi:hypothetical protein